MVNFGKKIVKYRVTILVISILLLIPSAFGYINTKVNYDILYYLPGDIDTMVGQDILLEDFGKGAFSMFMVEGMQNKDVSELKKKIEQVDGVDSVIWYDSILDISVPTELLPEKLLDVFQNGDTTLMAIFFENTTSASETMEAIEEIRRIGDKQCFLAGMSAVVTDTKNLSDQETPIYVMIAVLLSVLVLSVTMDSFLAPFMFLLSIGMAIVYNLGSNYFFGEVSYITKALSAVLQLGVTMDYSIFLWHSYRENQERFPNDKNRAMAHAISNTLTSVVGSSITTIAGFIALCFMSFTLGKDLGLVMAKGVVFGVVGCITILPSMILIFDRALEKTMHRPLIPDIGKCAGFITKHSWVFVALFLAILFPALYGYTHTDVYYNLDRTLPKELSSITANEKLERDFNMNSIHMVLADTSLDGRTAAEMLKELDRVDGISFALGFDSFAGGAVPGDFFPEELTSKLKGDRYQLMLVASEYKVASDEVNAQIELLNDIVKKYDPKGMVIGEAPCTKDLIEITDVDFQTVSTVSILAVFVIIAFVFRSISLPVLLVAVIEFAIFINMGIPCFTKTELPFIASIVIGTIQLGATVDYAILMTTRYRKERSRGNEKLDAVTTALSTSMSSILISAFCFFAATFGVGLYSDIDMISSLCSLMARGALISMVVVNCVLPSMLLLFDRVVIKTSYNFLGGRNTADKKAGERNKSKENQLA